jgi:hypothetical protein
MEREARDLMMWRRKGQHNKVNRKAKMASGKHRKRKHHKRTTRTLQRSHQNRTKDRNGGEVNGQDNRSEATSPYIAEIRDIEDSME